MVKDKATKNRAQREEKATAMGSRDSKQWRERAGEEHKSNHRATRYRAEKGELGNRDRETVKKRPGDKN